MLSCYTAHDPAVNRRKSYQPTISHYLPYYADCCFLGASKASADDLDTFQTITLLARDCNIVATLPSQFATPAEARAEVDPAPARAPAAVVPAVALWCFRRPCRQPPCGRRRIGPGLRVRPFLCPTHRQPLAPGEHAERLSMRRASWRIPAEGNAAGFRCLPPSISPAAQAAGEFVEGVR
mgnify:CR=1 FL=1